MKNQAKFRIFRSLLVKAVKRLISIIEYLTIAVALPAIWIIHYELGLNLMIAISLHCFGFLVFYALQYVDKRYLLSMRYPVPDKWFTQEDEYGEVTVEKDRLQEMILYVNDVERFIIQNGLKHV